MLLARRRGRRPAGARPLRRQVPLHLVRRHLHQVQGRRPRAVHRARHRHRRRLGGHRRLLGLDAIDTESYDGWKSFLLSLRARGVDGVTCVTSDAHEGLKRAIRGGVFPGAAWQRRIVHQMRNAAGNAPTRQKRGAVSGIPKAVFAERDPELVREPYHLATEQIEEFCPKAAEVLEEVEADALAYLDFPTSVTSGREPTTCRSAPTASSSAAPA